MLFKVGGYPLHALEVCAKHEAITLSSCQDILLFVLTHLHDVMYQQWDLTFRSNH